MIQSQMSGRQQEATAAIEAKEEDCFFSAVDKNSKLVIFIVFNLFSAREFKR